MKQWSASCGTSVSATWRSVVPSSSDRARRSPVRSSSAILSRSGWLLWPVAWRATMTIYVNRAGGMPQRHRLGAHEDPGSLGPDRGERAVPGPAVEHLLGQLGRPAEVFLLETQGEQGPADQALRHIGEPEQLCRVGVGVQEIALPVGDHDRRVDLPEHSVRQQISRQGALIPRGHSPPPRACGETGRPAAGQRGSARGNKYVRGNAAGQFRRDAFTRRPHLSHRTSSPATRKRSLAVPVASSRSALGSKHQADITTETYFA